MPNSKSLSAINDRLVPKDENDRSVPYYHWWPKEGTTEWISYEFSETKTISSCSVFWYDDGPWGGCRVPQSWRILYRDKDGKWLPVENLNEFGTKKGVSNSVLFKAITTDAIKMEVDLPEKNSTGVFEWEVE